MIELLNDPVLLTGMQNMQLSADGMDGLIETGTSLLKWFQRFGIIGAAIAFCIGAYYLMFGGDRGRGKAVGWFIGATVGLIIIMGATGIANGIDSNIKFGN